MILRLFGRFPFGRSSPYRNSASGIKCDFVSIRSSDARSPSTRTFTCPTSSARNESSNDCVIRLTSPFRSSSCFGVPSPSSLLPRSTTFLRMQPTNAPTAILSKMSPTNFLTSRRRSSSKIISTSSDFVGVPLITIR